jgi:carboxymethylenebutenolidase
MQTFIAHPDGQGPFRAVVMYQNVGGLSDILRGMARRVADAGYYCAVPALYYRLGSIVIDPDSHDEEVLALRKIASGSMRNERVMADTKALLEYLDGDSLVKGGHKGTIGYCMGGRFSILAAEHFPETFAATTSLFGTRLITDNADSPHLKLDRIRGELYCGFAEHDPSMPLPTVDKFKQLLEANCTAKFQVEVHPGTEHGYAFPGRRVYHREASERSWEQTFGMFRRQIPAAAR